MSDPGNSQTNAADGSPDWDAIARFLADESPADEAAQVRAWLPAHPGDRQMVERLDEAARLPVAAVDVEAALRGVRGRMQEAPAAPRLSVVRGAAPRRRSAFMVPAILAAAGVIAVVVARRPPGSDGLSRSGDAKTYATDVGRRDSIVLSDGSRVILGPASRLTVARDYGTATRSVELQGDGYFDVKHDGAKPFTVRVAHAVVEDLGTTFAIESDPGDTTNVSVLSGSVRFRAAGAATASGAVLAAGDRGTMGADGRVLAYPHSVTDDAVAWTAGRLVFRDASLARVAGELRRWYGVNLQIADSSLVNRHVTVDFNGESVDQVLKVIGLMLGARIEHHGDSAIVTSHRGSTTTR